LKINVLILWITTAKTCKIVKGKKGRKESKTGKNEGKKKNKQE
jgi:hypothetical protein